MDGFRGYVMTLCNQITSTLKFGVSSVLCVAFLAACDDLTLGGGNSADSDGNPSATVNVEGGKIRIRETDVEAPDIFALRAQGLWDGRPSLGGLWVAVPGNVDPDRVRITNLDNGQTVIGSLFGKEVDNPGPPILVSSAAAAAIGMTAGKPAKMSLVVLRRETVEIVSSAPEAPVEEAVAGVVEDPVAETAVVETTTASKPADGEITTQSLEATVLSAIDETEKPAAPAAPVSSVARPFIQVATVPTPLAANNVVKKLQGGGVSAEVRTSRSGSKTAFRVVVGPVADAAAQSAALKKIRALGYKDAFPVK